MKQDLKKEVIMEPFDFKGKWDYIKGKIKEEHPDWTEEDLKFEEGKEEDIYGRFQERLGKSKQDILDWFNRLDKR